MPHSPYIVEGQKSSSKNTSKGGIPTMKKLQWLKTKVGIFEDPQVKYMMHQPNGDSYVLVWFMLKDLAAVINDSGWIYLAKAKAFTAETLAYQLGRRRRFMEQALAVYEELDLIEIDDEGFIRLTTWDEDQGGDRADQVREQTRKRVASYRQRQRETAQPGATPAEEITATDAIEATAEPVTPEKEPLRLDGPCCKHYEKTFGGISPHIATKLAEAEQDWGEEAVLEAIDIARENDVSNIKYILKILRNKGADLGRQRHERNQTTDEHIDEVFRKAQELYERRNRKKRHANGGLTHVSN